MADFSKEREEIEALRAAVDAAREALCGAELRLWERGTELRASRKADVEAQFEPSDAITLLDGRTARVDRHVGKRFVEITFPALRSFDGANDPFTLRREDLVSVGVDTRSGRVCAIYSNTGRWGYIPGAAARVGDRILKPDRSIK